jgi:hypothetical protein
MTDCDDARFLALCAKERAKAKRRRARGLDPISDKDADTIRKNEAENRATDRYHNWMARLMDSESLLPLLKN